MTIIGAHVSAGGTRALVWCDSEFYRDDVAAGHTQKMIVNPLIGAVAVGAGTIYTNLIAFEVLQNAVNFDEAVNAIRDDLRSAYLRPGYSRENGCTVLLVGWSHRLRRIAGFAFSGSSEFAPRPITSLTSPAIADFEYLHPESAEDVVATAHAQMREVQRAYPSY
jgi:hypothetical protein